MIRTLETVTDQEIRTAHSIRVVVGEAEPVFILPPVEGEDTHPGLVIIADSIEAAERRVEQVRGPFVC